MKVLLFTLEYPPHYGGVANYYYNLIKFWPEQNDIFVLNNNRSELINSNLFFLKWLPSFKACYLSIKKNRIEHIIVGHILPLGIVAYLFNLFFNIGYSIVLHGMDFPFALKVKRKKFLTRLILSRADNIICVNSYVSKIAKEFLGSDQKIRIINPGINVKENYALKDKEKKVLVDQYNLKDKYILLSVGRLVKRKGFDYVIKTLKEVIKEIPNLIYVIIGKGEDENNLKQLITSDLENKVILLNNVNDNEKRIWYNICNCFIMPARNIDGDFEGFGIVYLEANLAGIPVIAGNSGGVSDAVKNEINGLVVDPENIDAIGKAIIKLAKDKKLGDKLVKQGREYAISNFSWSSQINKLFLIIKSNVD